MKNFWATLISDLFLIFILFYLPYYDLQLFCIAADTTKYILYIYYGPLKMVMTDLNLYKNFP